MRGHMPLMTTDGNLLSDADIKEAAQTASAEIKRQAKRIAELEAQIAEIHASTRRMSFRDEWYLEGVRNPPGDYVLMRIGPVTSEDVPF